MGALDLIGQTAKGIVELPGNVVSHVGRGLKYVGEAERAKLLQPQLLNDINKIKAAGGVNTAAGRAMLSELTGKYSPDMFRDPYMQSKAEYLSYYANRNRGLQRLQNDLQYWQKVLKDSFDPIEGVLNQKSYDAAQQNINRLTGEIQNFRESQSRVFDNVTSPEELAKQQSQYLSDIVIGPEQPKVRRGYPSGRVGDWPSALYNADLTEFPKLQQIATSRGIPTKTPAALPTSGGSLMSRIARINVGGRVIGAKRAGEIVQNYPKLSKKIVSLKPDELKEVINAINSGMDEEIILSFFR